MRKLSAGAQISVLPFYSHSFHLLSSPNIFLHPSRFLPLPPFSTATDHEESKYVHEVKQSVNLWNTLAMRSAALHSFQQQKKKRKRRKKKTQGWPPLQRGYSISMSFFISHWWIIQGDLPTTEWERKKGEGDAHKKKKKEGPGRCAEVVVCFSGCSCCRSTCTKPISSPAAAARGII